MVSVDFSPDGRLIVSGSFDGTARVWDVGSGRELWVRTNTALRSDQWLSSRTAGDWSPAVSTSTATVWEVASGKELFQP